MEGPTNIFLALIIIGFPILLLIVWSRGYFRLKERQLDAETTLAAEKAAQYAASNAELEARVRVLEQIVTDGGMQTAAQIEALREPKQAKLEKSR
jgi:ABC-type phosphate transport system auxiliary subunit